MGPRLPFVTAACLALVTTALYGTGWGFLVFFIARLGWGIGWSAFRQGGYELKLGHGSFVEESSGEILVNAGLRLLSRLQSE